MQVAELVDDGGLGLAADLAAGALAVAGVPEGDLAAPQAGAIPVAVRVAARAAVLEGDAVLAAPAPGSHGASLALVGTIMVTTAANAQALPDSSGPQTAGRISGCPRSVLVSALLGVHGKEKVYGSIP